MNGLGFEEKENPQKIVSMFLCMKFKKYIKFNILLMKYIKFFKPEFLFSRYLTVSNNGLFLIMFS